MDNAFSLTWPGLLNWLELHPLNRNVNDLSGVLELSLDEEFLKAPTEG